MDPSMLMMLLQAGQQQSRGAGAGQFLSGLFGDSGGPAKAYGEEYGKFNKQAQEAQNPFYNAGKGAIPEYQGWLQGQKDPSQFINGLMNNYQESPYAKFQKNQGQNAINNASSASGLMGSSAMNNASADYARNISSQDQNQWLQNVLGINTQYGTGQKNLMDSGQHSADILSQLKELLAQNMGQSAYGQNYGEQQDRGNMIGGGLKFLYS